jgi:DNA uptake protein ComE-like DNA-binding protein
MSDGPFHFPRRERLGMIIWTLLALLVWWLPQWFPEPPLDYAFFPATPTDDSAAVAMQAAFAEPAPTALHPFDPNTVTRDELIAFGLSERAAKGWVNYRRAAGDYADLAALQKVRAITPAELARVEPYLQFSAAAAEEEAAFTAGEAAAEPATAGTAPEYFPFDPNTVTEAELIRLGLTEREATSLLRYRAAGAQFRSEEDWLRIRAVAAGKLQALQPYLELPAPAEPAIASTDALRERATYTPATIDINSAGPADWQQLPGIGEYWSGRILAFRRALGGFLNVAQVAETRGLPDSVFQRIQPYLQSETPIAPIPINHVTEEELARHPYVSRRQATVLLAFRTQRGRLTAADFANFKAMKAADRERLLPYLSFE